MAKNEGHCDIILKIYIAENLLNNTLWPDRITDIFYMVLFFLRLLYL